MLNRTKAGCHFRMIGGNRLRYMSGVFLSLLMVLAVAAPLQAIAQGRVTLVEVDNVVAEPLSQTQPVQGRFVARQSGPVAAQTRGAVMEMHVFVGDEVTAGDPLATLDTGRLQAETARRRAEVQYRTAQVEGAVARHDQATQELARTQKLRRSAAFSRARFDDQTSAVISAKSEIAESQAQLETAKAELALAEIDLRNSTVVAPYSGVVTQRHTQAGAYLRDGDPVVDLVDHQSLEIEADVPSSRVAGVKKGMEIVAIMDGQKQLSAIVRAVIPQENTLSRTRAVRFSPSFDPTKVGAAAEAAVTVRIPVGVPREVVTVHKDAIVQQGGAVVFVVEEGKVVRKKVQLGESTGSRFVVKDGLTVGMVTVVRGNERLRPGLQVKYKGMKPPPGADKAGPAAGGKGVGDGKGKPPGAKKGSDS